jgi:putative peptidoglycan lipid II flippase
MTLVRAMATVGGMTLVSRISGFARDVLTANTMGASAIADAFFVALKLPNFFRSITAEGAFSISFVPLYSQKMVKDGEDTASKFSSLALSFMIAVLVPFSILMMVFMPWVIMTLAPGFQTDSYKFQIAVEMARLSFPYLLFVSIAALLGAILNAHNKFGPYAFAPVLFNLSLIASIFLVTPFTATQGHAMAVGMTLSGILQVLWVYRYLHRMGLKIHIVWPRITPDVKHLFKLMGPGILVAGAFQVNLFINLMIASTLPQGAISYLYYADRLYQLPFGVIGIAVGTALLPLFSQALHRGDRVETNSLYNRSLEYMLMLCLPAAFGLLLAAEPIIAALFQHGAYSAIDTQMTTLVLMAYAVGLPAYVISRVYNAVFYAHQDTWSPVKIALITTGLNIVLSYAFSLILGVMGIALSTALVGWLSIFLLNRAVAARNLDLRFDRRLMRAFPKLLICTGLMAVTLIIVRHGLHDALHGTFYVRVPALVALISSACLVYFPSLFALKILTFDDVKRLMTRPPKAENNHDQPPTLPNGQDA